MRFHPEIVLFTSCVLICCAPVAVDSKVERVPLDDKGIYFSFVDENGALSETYEEAEKKCNSENGVLWDINDSDGVKLRSGKFRANQEVAKAVLNKLRAVKQVEEKQLKDEVLKRLNVVIGNRTGLGDEECKWYLAGPYTPELDFYAFTFYDKCPKTEDQPGFRSWFVCQKEPDAPPEPTEPTTTDAPDKDTPRTTSKVTEKSTQQPTTEGDTVNTREEEISKDIENAIEIAEDAGDLIGNVTDLISGSENPFKLLEEHEEEFIRKIVKLVGNNTTMATNATRDLFSDMVPRLAKKMSGEENYVSLVNFVKNSTSKIAILTGITTEITNMEDGKESKEDVRYRLKHEKIPIKGSYTSRVQTSTVKMNYKDQDDDNQTSILMTHMEFTREKIQKAMVDKTYNGTKKFSSDLVEFFLTFGNGDKTGGSVDIFFERKTKQAKRVDVHQCIFYNVEEGNLDDAGCEFKSVTEEGDVHCSCNHTTTYGSVFLPQSFDDNLEAVLDSFSFIMDFFSLSALLLSILIFGLIRQIRTVLTVIHLNLCICLFVSELIIVIHNLAYLNSTSFRCEMWLGLLIQYSFLTVIAWSTLEGIYILQLMIVVFKPPESHTRYYLMAGYLVPLIFPAINIPLDGAYSIQSGQLCFLKPDWSGPIWTFLVPVLIMLGVNVVAICTVMYRLCTINRSVKTVKSELLRYLRGILCMTALLGLQWLLGIVSLPVVWDPLKFAFIILFVFFTLAQGPLIFVVHIMLVKDTRYAVARYLAKRGRFSRCIANYIRPPPPATETHLHHGSNSTKSTDIASSNHSSSAPQTPFELKIVPKKPARSSLRV